MLSRAGGVGRRPAAFLMSDYQKARCHRALRLDPPPSSSGHKSNNRVLRCSEPRSSVSPWEPFWDVLAVGCCVTWSESLDGRIWNLPDGIHNIPSGLKPVWNLHQFAVLFPFGRFCSSRSFNESLEQIALLYI